MGKGHKFVCEAFWKSNPVATSKVRLAASQALRWRHHAWGESGPWGFIPWYSLQTEKHGKPLVKVAERCLLGMIHYVDMVTCTGNLDKSVDLGFRWVTSENLVQPSFSLMCLSSCRTKGFATPTNFASNLSVRDLMWSAMNGIPKSS
jgi:hypothetical protein